MRGADPAFCGKRGQEQALAGAVEHQHFRGGIDGARERVAAVEPLRDGFAEGIEPLVHRVAAELIDMRRDDRPDERGNRMLRLADSHADRRLAGRHVAQKLAQPHKRRARIGRADR